MRISERIIFVALIAGVASVTVPVFAFDGAPVSQDAAIPDRKSVV
jgi:hypothetical protein